MFQNVNLSDYVGLVPSGGRAPESTRYDPDLMWITKAFYGGRKPVASVCHGIEILAAADVISGKEAMTVAKCQYDCEFSGGVSHTPA